MQQPFAPTQDATTSAEPTLKDLVDKNIAAGGHGLNLAQVVTIVVAIAAELDRLHANGTLSTNVTPEHILVPAGKPAQLARPHARNAESRPQGDITALASAAYFALCGVEPTYFRHMPSGQNAEDFSSPGFLAPPNIHRPDLPVSVQDVLVSSLTPASGAEYVSAGAFAAALQKAAKPGLGVFVPALAVTPLVRRSAAIVLSLILLAVVLVHFASIYTARTVSSPGTSSTAPAPVAVVPPAVPVTATLPSSTLVPIINVPPPLLLQSLAHHPALTPGASTKTLTVARSLAAKDGQPSSALPIKTAAVMSSRAHLDFPSSGRATYIRVYARQYITVSDVLRHRARTVRARRILVDGKPSQALVSGRFAQITPGRHMLAFYPRQGIPFDPNIHCWITVERDSRRAIQIPLPRHPGYLSIAHR